MAAAAEFGAGNSAAPHFGRYGAGRYILFNFWKCSLMSSVAFIIFGV
jgi:hypothetical protein